MTSEKEKVNELRSIVDRLSSVDDDILHRLFVNRSAFPSAPENREFISRAIERLLEAGADFAVVNVGGRISISGGEATYGTDLIPERWSDGRWRLGHEPADEMDNSEDIYGPHPP